MAIETTAHLGEGSKRFRGKKCVGSVRSVLYKD